MAGGFFTTGAVGLQTRLFSLAGQKLLPGASRRERPPGTLLGAAASPAHLGCAWEPWDGATLETRKAARGDRLARRSVPGHLSTLR